MKKKYLLLAAAALLVLPTAPSLAAEEVNMNGMVELGAQISDGEEEGAKAQEYQDLGDTIFGNFFLDYFTSDYFFSAEGENAGMDDQSYLLKGSSYQKFKYNFFYNEIPHNLSFGARSFYSGIGSDNLSIGAPPSDPATWRGFDYKTDTTQYGGEFQLSLAAPYYLKVGVSRQEEDGLKPLGSGSFSGVVEMPEPIDYATNNFRLTGGYTSEQMSLKISGLYSSFTNDNEYLDWFNPFLGITETNSLPPDNDFARIGADLVWHQLPMNSTLALGASYSNLSNEISVFDINAPVPAGLNQTEFDGDISTFKASASYLSQPMDDLETRLFYEYFDRENDSTIIEYDDGSNATHLFEYSKHNAGIIADYDLIADTSLGGGYEFEYVDRNNRPDASSTTDNMLFLAVKNTTLEYLTAKVEYTFLHRDADEDFDLRGLTLFDAGYVRQFISRFDVTSKIKNAVEFAVEVYPMETVDLGLSYTFVNNDYDDVTLGRTDDTGHEFYVDVMWRAARMLNVSGFAGYEYYEADSDHYNFAPGQLADPRIDDGNPASYRWSQTMEDNFWTIGLMGQMPLMQDRLKLSLSWQYQESDGESDFSTQGTTPLLPIEDFEDYYINTIEAKAAYALSDAMDLTLGYFYEESNYDDLQYLGYDYTPQGTYLSGAYADYDYDTHVGYLTVRYKF